MTGPARITATWAGDARCVFPYDAGIVARIKEIVPAYCRAYDPRDHSWTVEPPYIAGVVELIVSVYPDAIIDARFTADAGTSGPSVPGAAPSRSVAIDPDFAELHLLPTAPPELITVAYRCLARLNHPDTGGSTAAMQRLNEAVAIVRARRDLEATA